MIAGYGAEMLRMGNRPKTGSYANGNNTHDSETHKILILSLPWPLSAVVSRVAAGPRPSGIPCQLGPVQTSPMLNPAGGDGPIRHTPYAITAKPTNCQLLTANDSLRELRGNYEGTSND